MKILVTFKVIPDLDQMSAGDYCADERMMVDTSFVRTILNCFDESGLEFGLRLSDEAEGLNLVVETTALTVAEKQAELYLKTLAALKYSHTVCVNAEGRDLRFEPESVAESVYRYCKEHPQDYIIMGNQAAPGNNGLTPKILAEKLGVLLLENVVDLHVKEDGELEVTTEEEDGVYVQEISVPAILSIGNAVISKLRVPTLKARMASKEKESEFLKMPEQSERRKKTLVSLKYVNRERAGEILEGDEGLRIFAEKYEKNKRE